jgi:hypothetical protein
MTSARHSADPRRRHSADFLARAERYGALASDPRIGGRTAFFSAARAVTLVLAFSPVSEFIAELSLHLERVNDERAQQVRSGRLYSTRNLLANTADFVRFEQHHVQMALERLHTQCPARFVAEVRTLNRNIRRAAHWLSRFLSPAHEAMYRAIRASRAALGRWPDFRDRRDREMLGLQLAISTSVAIQMLESNRKLADAHAGGVIHGIGHSGVRAHVAQLTDTLGPCGIG